MSLSERDRRRVGRCGSAAEDPEGHGGLTEPDDPEGHGGLTEPDDPEGHGGLTEPDDPLAGGCGCGCHDGEADPEGHGGLTEPDDPSRHRRLCTCGRRHPIDDPEGHGGLTEPDDPEGHGGLTDPDDPEGHGGLTEPDDPEGHGGLTEPDDPSAGRCACGCRRRRRRRCRPRKRRHCDSRAAERPASVAAGGTPDERSGFVIVRLSEEIPPTEFDELGQLAGQFRLVGLAAILDELELGDSPRVVPATCDKRVLIALEECAACSELPPLHSLGAYWRLDLRGRPERSEELVRRLNGLVEIDLAYRELVVSQPSADPTDDTYASGQGYLDPAPVGINARWAWTQDHGAGQNAAIVDLEQGWLPNHVDLRGHSPELFHGVLRADGSSPHHGTAVLGIVCGVDNAEGVIGIAPGVGSVRMVSHYDGATTLNVAAAIYGALTAAEPLAAGHVLLLEVQRSYKPTEIDEADFTAIRLASALGIIVVEAAGNGASDLDGYRSASGATPLRRCSVHYRESGAIVVAAARSELPHDRKLHSNYGSRVDCYGWGTHVVTCGFGDLDDGDGDPERAYTQSFSNTSAASPIVAGAALVTQSVYSGTTGDLLAPLQMRSLLSNPLLGTPQGTGEAGHIGVMPDLRTVLEEGLGLVPDTFLRDRGGDDGRLPRSAHCASSPDLIASPRTMAEPEWADLEADGSDCAPLPGSAEVETRDRYLYARIHNRGQAPATGVAATFYWAGVETLLTPDRWHLIGTSKAVEVPQGETAVVAGPVAWEADCQPRGRQFSLIGVIDGPHDPAPPLPFAATGSGWIGFPAFLRNHNNVAFANRHRIGVLPERGEAVELPFRLSGTPAGDRRREFDFEIVQRLPAGMELWFELPSWLGGRLASRHRCRRERLGSGVLGLRLPRRRSLVWRRVGLPSGLRQPVRFVLRGAGGPIRGGGSIHIRQLFRGREVGRVTWWLDVEPRRHG